MSVRGDGAYSFTHVEPDGPGARFVVELDAERMGQRTLSAIGNVADYHPGDVALVIDLGERRVKLGHGVDPSPEFRAALERALEAEVIRDGR